MGQHCGMNPMQCEAASSAGSVRVVINAWRFTMRAVRRASAAHGRPGTLRHRGLWQHFQLLARGLVDGIFSL
jgi:hypothetical protein